MTATIIIYWLAYFIYANAFFIKLRNNGAYGWFGCCAIACGGAVFWPIHFMFMCIDAWKDWQK